MKHTDDTQQTTSIGDSTRISVVVPAKDEAENLPELYRNFGQTAALDAGIKEARYPCIVEEVSRPHGTDDEA